MPYHQPTFAEAMDEMGRAIREALGVPEYLLRKPEGESDSVLVQRMREEAEFRLRPALDRALTNLMFQAFIKVQDRRRIKRERIKYQLREIAEKRARGLVITNIRRRGNVITYAQAFRPMPIASYISVCTNIGDHHG